MKDRGAVFRDWTLVPLADADKELSGWPQWTEAREETDAALAEAEAVKREARLEMGRIAFEMGRPFEEIIGIVEGSGEITFPA